MHILRVSSMGRLLNYKKGTDKVLIEFRWTIIRLFRLNSRPTLTGRVESHIKNQTGL